MHADSIEDYANGDEKKSVKFGGKAFFSELKPTPGLENFDLGLVFCLTYKLLKSTFGQIDLSFGFD